MVADGIRPPPSSVVCVRRYFSVGHGDAATDDKRTVSTTFRPRFILVALQIPAVCETYGGRGYPTTTDGGGLCPMSLFACCQLLSSGWRAGSGRSAPHHVSDVLQIDHCAATVPHGPRYSSYTHLISRFILTRDVRLPVRQDFSVLVRYPI